MRTRKSGWGLLAISSLVIAGCQSPQHTKKAGQDALSPGAQAALDSMGETDPGAGAPSPAEVSAALNKVQADFSSRVTAMQSAASVAPSVPVSTPSPPPPAPVSTAPQPAVAPTAAVATGPMPMVARRTPEISFRIPPKEDPNLIR